MPGAKLTTATAPGLDRRVLPADLAELRRVLPGWKTELDLAASRFSAAHHGDWTAWHQAVSALPDVAVVERNFRDTITFRGPITPDQQQQVTEQLRALHPWRKGPFQIFNTHIDTEWRSDWKWRRVEHALDLRGKRVLDIGSGNGYFGWRMLAAGADMVMGIDPTLVFCMQHQAIKRYYPEAANWVVPLKDDELSATETFDAVFSMGVVYHRRDAADHVRRLAELTRPGGIVVLESLVVANEPLHPGPRYARMRNVHVVPTTELMCEWLSQAGLQNPQPIDVTPTTTREQRSTDWMRFESLSHALAPDNPTTTIEGHPAPVRAIVVARKPTDNP